MMIVRLNDGTEIEAEVAFYADQFRMIHIYTRQLSMQKACEMFENTDATSTITFIREGDSDQVYNGFTELYAVQKGRAAPVEGTTLIWLQPPNQPISMEESTIGRYLNAIR